MVVKIALGIILAAVLLSSGRAGLVIALAIAGFYFGLGWLVILIAALVAVMVALVYTTEFIGDLLRDIKTSRPRELRWEERKEPTMKAAAPKPANGPIEAEFVTDQELPRRRRIG